MLSRHEMPPGAPVLAGNSPIDGEDSPPSPRRTVLVLEDEGLMRWTMRERLGREGYGVVEAELGKEALTLARSRSFDLALLDVHLPDMDGVAVLERIRAEGFTGPVILMTAYGTEPCERAAAFGPVCCVGKPFDLERMIALIGAQLAAG